jgi:hypothetical protein
VHPAGEMNRVAIPATLRLDRAHLLGLYVDIGATATLVALGGDDLVVVLSEVETDVTPRVELLVSVVMCLGVADVRELAC